MPSTIEPTASDVDFAANALSAGAIDLNEFRQWGQRVAQRGDLDELPGMIIEFAELRRQIAGCPPGELLSTASLGVSSRDEWKDALCALAVLRGRGADCGCIEMSRVQALETLSRHPGLLRRFQRMFPQIGLPDTIRSR